MGFLRPVAMVKIGLLGLKEDREKVVALLHDSGVVQVEPLRKEASALLPSEPGGELQRTVSEELLRFRTLKGALPRRELPERPAYARLDDILAEARTVPVDDEVGRLKSEEDHLLSERRGLTETIELLGEHSYYADRLGLLQLERLLAFFGEATPAAYRRLRGEVEALGPSGFLPSVGPEKVRFLIAVPKEQSEALGRIAQQSGVRLIAVPALEGTISEELPRLRGERDRIDRRLAEIRARLGEIANAWYPKIAALEEALAIENRKFEAWSRMGAGSVTFALEGWVPRRSLPQVRAALSRVTGERTNLFEIPTQEEPPTLMDNPPGIRWFEFFIRFYAIPRATEFDPTWIFAIAFPIFFGLMIGDVGYASVILVISLWMIAGFPGGGKLPKSLRGFLTMIMGPRGMQMLARTLVPGCLIGIATGVIYNAWFGFQLPFYPRFFDPLAGVGKVLVLAGYIGLTMVTVGFFLGALKAYYHHHPRHVIARVGGILFAWGIAIIGLAVLHSSFSITSLSGVAGLGLVLGGIAAILIGEGGQGAMAITEIVSHILSYSRLVGILLSAVVLSYIIDLVFWGNVTNPAASLGLRIGFAILGLLILVVGQIFVLVLSVFEPGIQGARLIFVEHFSKFYEGNGRPFAPFASNRTYTRPAFRGEEPSTIIVGPGARPENPGAGS
jgi:V/A-type H+-transporting ATPase subunit I